MSKIDRMFSLSRSLKLSALAAFILIMLAISHQPIITSVSLAQSRCVPMIANVTGKLVSPDELDIDLDASDCDSDTTTAVIKLLNARGDVVATAMIPLSQPPPSEGSIHYFLPITGLSNFLGSCTAQVTLTDKAGNISAPALVNYRSCTLPIIGNATVNVLNGDQLQISIRGGDPDLNTNKILLTISDAAGNILRGPDTIDSSAVTFGFSDFVALLTVNGISLLNNPSKLQLALKDAQGNTSNLFEVTFTAIKGTPDLTVPSIMLNPPSVIPGSKISFDFTIRNSGDAPAGPTMAEIRLSKDSDINSMDLLLDSFSVSSLNPGQTASGTRMVTIPANTSSGNFFIGIIADSDNGVKELNENNNSTSRPLTVILSADSMPPQVSIISPKTGDSFKPGEMISISFNSTDNVGVTSQDIDLSTDGGQTFTSIAQMLPGSAQQFTYQVPTDFRPATRQAVVRVIARDAAGNIGMATSSQFSIGDSEPPMVQVISPAGGETLMAGNTFDIRFTGSDNQAVTGFTVAYSTDGGQTFPNQIGRLGPPDAAGNADLIWNIPDALATNQARIQVIATDSSGNSATAVSGIFTVAKQPSTIPLLQVTISFDPPPAGQVLPPQNVRVVAKQATSIANRGSFPGNPTIAARARAVDQAEIGPDVDIIMVVGYNIYRVPEPPEGLPLPTPDQIVNPANLIGSVDASTTMFNDMVSTGKSDSNNFVYSIASFFNNGDSSGGSQPTGTDLPVIKHPRFAMGTIFIDAAGSFIKSGAMLVVNDNESFPLVFDQSGTLFTVPKKTPSSNSALTIKKLIKKGSTVKLVIKNLDGKTSVTVSFKR